MIERAAVVAAAFFVLASSSPAAASDPDTAGIERAFAEMKQGIEKNTEGLFKGRWDPRGYRDNLVGGSGIAGKSVYRQGARKRWYLKPDMRSIRSLPRRRGSPWIITCDIWSWIKNRAVDRIYALVIYNQRLRKWVMLGGGERLAEVEALGVRYVANKPLAPPAKKRR